MNDSRGRRVLVVTLHSGEQEFDACRDSVARQTLAPIEHVIISGLPKMAAHAALHRACESRADACDVFVKLDADMVIAREDLLERIAERFVREPELDHLKIAVQDFYSDRLIGALNAYRSTSRWARVNDNFTTDAGPIDRRAVVEDWTDLAPAALHSPDPSPFQAFHFGLHKGLKVHAAARQHRVDLATRHFTNIEKTWTHYRRTRDARLLLASVGAEVALSGTLGVDDIDYESVAARQACARYAAMPQGRLALLIRGWRVWNRRGLPPAWRSRQLAFGWWSFVRRAALGRQAGAVA